MDDITNPNDQAFPIRYHSGLTKREYFAAMAMQGIQASNASAQFPTTENVAEYAVEVADALIQELNKEKL